MSVLLKLVLPSLIRSVLIVAGGIIIGKGYIDSGTWDTIAGIIMAAVGGVWGITSKMSPAKKIEVLNQVATTHPGIVTNAADIKGIAPGTVMPPAAVYPNNPPAGH